jgi:hypothetical protein
VVSFRKPRQRLSGIHGDTIEGMDSGLAPAARPGMTN